MKRKIKIEDFPQVWKGHRTVVLVYRDHSETYEFESKYSNKEAQEANACDYDPYHEVEILKNNGWRRVHGKKEIQIWRS